MTQDTQPTKLVYDVAPDVEQSWQWIVPGFVVGVVGWFLAFLGSCLYVNPFASYNATYGSIGVVIVWLPWMYVSGFFVLLGVRSTPKSNTHHPTGKDPGERAPP